MKKHSRSLRAVITFCIIAVGIVPIVIINVLVFLAFDNSIVTRRRIEIRQHAGVIGTELGQSESIADALTEEEVQLLNWYSEAYGGRLLVIDISCKIVMDTYSADNGRLCISDAVFSALSGNDYENYDSQTGYLTFVLPITHESDQGSKVIGVLVMSSSTQWISDSVNNLMIGMLMVDVILAIMVILAAIQISGRIVRPVVRSAREVEKIRSGSLNADISSVTSYREVDKIMNSTSGVIHRYQSLEQTQEEFVSNVSHELKTPMASIRVLADSLIGQKNVPEELYQEFLTDISTEIDREASIVDDLLSMARLGKASDSMNIQTIIVNDLVMDVMHSVKPIAQKRNIELIYESFRQVTADVDDKKLKQAVTNLIENGVKYNNDGGWVKVSIDADHEYFYLKVADNGVGIPEDAVEHIFDRFYRVDKARSRETGGTGLGLSITKTIVVLHYGVIKVDSAPGEGSIFTVRIPLKHTEGGQ